jgi:hypothetical protein
MTIYLHGGWYKPGQEGGLRTEVLDGAMDTAGLLHRAGISPELVSRLALRVRSLVRLGDTTAAAFASKERDFLADRLMPITGESAEVVSFIADCLDHISSYSDLAAFYLHLVHITRMMQLLTMARLGPMAPGGGGMVAAALLSGESIGVSVPSSVLDAAVGKNKASFGVPKRKTAKVKVATRKAKVATRKKVGKNTRSDTTKRRR